MKKLSLILSLSFFASSLFAQFGVNAGYRVNGTTDWETLVGQEDFFSGGFKVGVDYWFRLKKVRIEFTPEINYSQFKSNYRSIQDDPFEFKADVYGFNFNTNIYPLNFRDDCNCPTFKKDGQILDKGFHFILSPGVNYYNFSINNDSYVTNDIVLSAGLGVGLDIGITDYVTLTPMVLYHRHFDVEWKDLDAAASGLNAEVEINTDATTTAINQLFFGVRLSFRFDEMNKYGYR